MSKAIYSPLRYPGGKNKLSAFVAKICLDNGINGHYVEPYSGGASVGLFLLLEGYVNRITINDKDRSIYAFWYSVLYHTEELCDKIKNAILTVEEWGKQRIIQSNKENADLLDLGFSTFYLNRTSRSGIIKAGVMGGVKQTGNYLMDCRFNKDELISRIRKIASHRDAICLYSLDALDLIDIIQNENDVNTLIYFDPPYYNKASSLYMNHYKYESHKIVSEKILAIENMKWMVSYDNVPEIVSLYDGCEIKEFSFKHTAYEIREGSEVLFLSRNLIQPNIDNWNPLNFKIKNKEIFYRVSV